jgi:hypothetical protein
MREEDGMGDEERRDEGISPAEFTKRMPEGQSAGEGAPETVEPHRGNQPEERGPGGPAMRGIGGAGPEGADTAPPGDEDR